MRVLFFSVLFVVGFALIYTAFAQTSTEPLPEKVPTAMEIIQTKSIVPVTLIDGTITTKFEYYELMDKRLRERIVELRKQCIPN